MMTTTIFLSTSVEFLLLSILLIILVFLGIFQSLQKNYNMSSHDIESAISICEESTILEIQLTDFLKHICSHMSYQHPPDSSIDQVFVDVVPTPPKTVKFDMPGLNTESPNSSEAAANKQKRSRYVLINNIIQKC